MTCLISAIRVSVTPDLDKIVQRFLRKPSRITLATILGVYRAVMRLSSIAGALDEAIDCSERQTDTHHGGEIDESTQDSTDGRCLMKKLVISPLQQVCQIAARPCHFYVGIP